MANPYDLQIQRYVNQRAADRQQRKSFFDDPALSQQMAPTPIEMLRYQMMGNLQNMPPSVQGHANLGAATGYGLSKLIQRMMGKGKKPAEQAVNPRDALEAQVQDYLAKNQNATYKQAVTAVARDAMVNKNPDAPEMFEYAEGFDDPRKTSNQDWYNITNEDGRSQSVQRGSAEEAELLGDEKLGWKVGEAFGPSDMKQHWVRGETIDPTMKGHMVSVNSAGKPMRVVKTGPNVMIETTWEEYMTAGGKNKMMENYVSMAESTFNLIDQIDTLSSKLKEPEFQDVLNTPGKLFGVVSDFATTAKAIVNGLTESGDPLSEKGLDYSKALSSGFAKDLIRKGNSAAEVKALFLDLAYAAALSREPGARFTEQDIQRGLDTMGGSVSNAEGALKLLQNQRTAAIRRLANSRFTREFTGKAPHIDKRLDELLQGGNTDDDDARLKYLGY